MKIVHCYAPTNDKTGETNEEFYNQLHDIMSNLGNKNVNLIMWDVNAKIGSDNQRYENEIDGGVHGFFTTPQYSPAPDNQRYENEIDGGGAWVLHDASILTRTGQPHITKQSASYA